MKRCWFGAGLMALLLVAGLLASRNMGFFHLELSENLNRAAQIIGLDREKAQEMADRAKERWENCRVLAAVLNDHAPMDTIEENFLLLTPQAEEEDFRETCLRLSAQLEALGKGQLLTLENLF